MEEAEIRDGDVPGRRISPSTLLSYKGGYCPQGRKFFFVSNSVGSPGKGVGGQERGRGR